MSQIKIMIACHKPYSVFPKNDIYLPIEVGSDKNKEHFCKVIDSIGDNIAAKHDSYAELTGLYWGWKNLNYDILGLCHYRRYLADKKINLKDDINNVLKPKTIEKLLSKNDFILPNITKDSETVYQHSIHCYNDHHMDIARDVVQEFYPTYLSAFDQVMNSKQSHFWNIFVCKKDMVDKYCEFLFGVLKEAEKRYVYGCPDPRSSRVFGYIGESMLDVFILANHYTYCERPVIFLERKPLIQRAMEKLKRRGEKD